MIRSCRVGMTPRRILAATAIALVPMVAGCEAGANAPSLQWHQPTDGTNVTVGDITISDAFVLGAPLGSQLRPGQNASMFLGIANSGATDRLVGISAPGTAASVQLAGGQVTLGQRPALLTGPQPEVILEHLLRPVTGGSVLTIVLDFQNAGTVRLRVPVMPMAQYYATFSPAPTPTPAPAPSPAKAGKKAHGTSSASPSPSPSASS